MKRIKGYTFTVFIFKVINGPAQFKPMLFKGQLYYISQDDGYVSVRPALLES